jgi:hypothetical protein
MSTKLLAAAVLLALGGFTVDADAACSVVLSSGANVQAALDNPANSTVCLSPGSYSLAAQLNVPNGKSLEGGGSTRDDVVLVSSADIAVYLNSNTQIKNLRIQNELGSTPTFGILTYYTQNVIVWGLRVHGATINIGINGSRDIHVWDTFMALNGRDNGAADPNLWITDAHDIDILWGEALGRNNGPGGDGEIAAYNSTNVSIYGTYVTNSGASAIYLVGCKGCKVENATIVHANEWGLDIVNGTDNFIAKNNRVSGSWYAGSVFSGSGYPNVNRNGQYIGNDFRDNNRSRIRQFCNGVAYSGSAFAFTMSGNTGSVLLCKAW